MYIEDDDIKIATAYPSREKKYNLDKITEEITKNLEEQRDNGNLDKSQEIGRRLAFSAYNYVKWPKGIDDFVKGEIRTLHVFSIYHGLDKHSPNDIVGENATSIFTNTLRDLDADYYEKINKSGSYSIYLLTLRKTATKIDPEEILGHVFAKQVGHEGENKWEDLGKDIFSKTLSSVIKKIEEYGFK